MNPHRLHVIKMTIEYDRYDPVVFYYDLDGLDRNVNPLNIFRDNEPVGVHCTRTIIALLDDKEWADYEATGKVGGNEVLTALQ